MYYRILTPDLNIDQLRIKLTQNMKPTYEIYFKKGSRFKFLQFIGQKDSVVIKKNSFYGYRLYLVKMLKSKDIAINEYIPSSILRNNPIPLGVWNLIIYAVYRTDKKEFYNELINALNKIFDGEILKDS